MKKKTLLLSVLLLLVLFLPQAVPHVAADFYEDDVPYVTHTVDYQGDLTATKTAFRPLGIFGGTDILDAPADLSIYGDHVYVADSGNGRIAVFDYDGNLSASIGDGILDNPTGLHVSEDGFLYVADKGLQAVFKFDLDGTLLDIYDRPTEPLFGASSPFVPIKVAVGAGENIYVIGEGSTSGVIQLNYDGSFLGYFGVNLSSKPFLQRIADLFVNSGEYASTTPPSPTNIAISSQSLVYTSTPLTTEALKKLDINGNNILTTVNYDVDQSIVDLAVNDAGYVFAIYDDGLVVEYDPSGNLLFAFNIQLASAEVVGLVRVPTGIEIDENGYLFVTDGQMDRILLFEPTAFAGLVHAAIDRYNDGSYDDSRALFEEIVRQNANFAIAHSALGKAYYQEGRMAEALAEYRLANDLEGYSDTFWKLRDTWLKANLSTVFVLLLALLAIGIVLRTVDRRTPAFAGIRAASRRVKAIPSVRRYTLLFDILRHPLNAFYEIKRERRATIGSATVVLVVLFGEYLLLLGTAGYLFNPYADSINLGAEIAKFFGAFGLFVFANYLVSTLSDGEGWLKDVYISAAYSLSPLVLGILPYILLTNIATQNETVLVQLLATVMIGWTVVLVFLAIKEIHNYEIRETVKNLLVTAFAMLIIVLIGFILYVFGSQLVDFVTSWLKEVANRVFG
jgi:tetratricopeptide (TPR) repeat protein